MNRVPVAPALGVLALLGGPFVAKASDPAPPGPWNLGAGVSLNLSQSSFSDNWAGGDKGVINWVLNADLDAKRQFSETFHWSNQLQLTYGQTSTQNDDPDGGRTWSRPDKTTDLILFESVGRWTLRRWVDPYLALRVDSQFADESDPLGALLFNPVKVAETTGFARPFVSEEDREVISRLGFGFRQTYARSFTDAAGESTESFLTNDGGLEFQTDAKLPMADGRVQYTGKLQVFWPLFFDGSSDLEDLDTLALAADPTHEEVADFWKTPDVNWQNTFTSEVTSWLNVNLYVQWVYDKYDATTKLDLAGADTDPAILAAAIRAANSSIRKSGQFKQTLGIGLSYRFL